MRPYCRLPFLFPIMLLVVGQAVYGADEATSAFNLPADTKLEQVIKSLATHTSSAVVADVSAVEPSTSVAQLGAPLEAVLQRLSKDFDRDVIRRTHSIALQRRFSDPLEDPGIEIEELRATVEDALALIRPFAPRLRGTEFLKAQDSFTSSLTLPQQESMLRDGLRFSDLTNQQRTLWIEINRGQAYGDAWREVRRASLCLKAWPRITVRDLAPQRLKHHDLGITFPDPEGIKGQDEIATQVPFSAFPRRPAFSGVFLMPATPAPEKELSEVWQFPVRKVSLAELSEAWSSDGGSKLFVPAYASQRQVWLASTGGSRRDVLAALCDLFGWELAPSQRGYELRRPRRERAQTAVELPMRLSAAVPPPIRHIAAACADGSPAWRGHQLVQLVDAAKQLGGPDWQSVPVAELKTTDQRRLANVMVVETLGLAFDHVVRRKRLWALHPEQGYFTLNGSLGPGRSPMVMFWVRENERTRHGWGWAVGSARYEK